jgi:alkylhydroperoxidase family enzyme
MTAAPTVRVPPARWPRGPFAQVVAALAGRATRGDPPRLFTTLGHNPRLFRRWLPFSGALLYGGELARTDRELVILRTAWRCGSWYEWAQHVELARRAGLAGADVERVAAGPEAPGWRDRQRLLLEAVDELHDRRVVTDATWAALAGMLDERQLIELCFLVGHYEMLAMTLNSLGVEPETSALDRLKGAAAEACDTLRRRLTTARRS